MKNLWILTLIIALLITTGCTQNEDILNINAGNEKSVNIVESNTSNGVNKISNQNESSEDIEVTNDSTSRNEQDIEMENVTEENGTLILTELTKEEALEIAKEAHRRYNIVRNLGRGIPDNIFEQPVEPIRIGGYDYYSFGTSIDTIDEFNAYLGEVLSNKSIEVTMKVEEIIIYEERLLKLPLDAGNSKNWPDAKIISINQTGEIANVVIETPLIFNDVEDSIVSKLTFVFNSNRGWLIDTDTPFEDLY